MLSQLSERVSDSRSGQWEFAEHDYAFINGHLELSRQQLDIVEQKTREVCAKLKIDNLRGARLEDGGDKRLQLADGTSRGRSRTVSWHDSSPRKRLKPINDSLESPPAKRQRQNSSLSDRSCPIMAAQRSADVREDREEEHHEEEHHEQQHLGTFCMPVPIKGEPCTMPDEEEDEDEDDEGPAAYVKMEAGERFQDKMEAGERFQDKMESNVPAPATEMEDDTEEPAEEAAEEDDSTNGWAAPGLPTESLQADIRQFVMDHLANDSIVPVTLLADAFHKVGVSLLSLCVMRSMGVYVTLGLC